MRILSLGVLAFLVLFLGSTVSPQFACAESPGTAPALLTPSNGAATDDQTPTFDWNPLYLTPPNTIRTYQILLDNNYDFLSPEISEYIVHPTTQFTPDSNLATGTYNWKVSAAIDIEGTFSSVWTVTIVD